MRKTISMIATLVVFAVSMSARADTYGHNGPILVSNVTVIDGRGNAPSPMRDILIENGHIVKTAVTGMIGELPEGAHVIDGRGLTAMPGLIDLHIHLGGVTFGDGVYEDQEPAAVQRTLNAHVYAGVMSVQDLGSDHDFIIGVRGAVERGERIGPTIYATGATVQRLQSVKDVMNLVSLETQSEISDLLDQREQAGIRTIKLYAGLSNWSARHIVSEAKKRDLRVIADFWCSNLGITVFRVTGVDGFAHGGCHEITDEDARWMRDHDKFAMMTFAAFDVMGGHRQYRDFESRGYLKDPLIVDPLGKQTVLDYYDDFTAHREIFEDGEESLYNSQLFGDIKHLVPTNQKNVVILHEAGVLIGLGTDAAFPPGNWPGEAMHFEMRMHVDAGIDPIDVIQMATYNGARILSAENEIGSIEKGKVADILIVRGNPAVNIDDTRKIVHVIKDGKLVDRSALKFR